MAANGTTGAPSSRDSANFDLTAAALAISIAAIVLSSLQALLAYLQFDNSEVGRRRCSEKVMGKLWASKTSSKFKPRDQRWLPEEFLAAPVRWQAGTAFPRQVLRPWRPAATKYTHFSKKSEGFKAGAIGSKSIWACADYGLLT